MKCILEILQEIRPDCDFYASIDFIGDGLIDSLDVMTLTAELEEKYKIKIPVSDIIPENYLNIEAISNLIRKCGGII